MGTTEVRGEDATRDLGVASVDLKLEAIITASAWLSIPAGPRMFQLAGSS